MNNANQVRNNRILVIDDNPSIHEDFRKILGPRGGRSEVLAQTAALLFGDEALETDRTEFHLDSAFQGEEGLRKVQQAEEAGRPYALAFVDVRMPPGWDGVETITQIWKKHRDLQVVICTAYSDYTWEDMVRRIGRSDSLVVLKKPFDNIEVLQLAHALTEKWILSHQVNCRLKDLDQLVSQRTRELQTANDTLKQEIAEQIKLETQLRQAQKMEAVGQLAAGVAHDFNNILTVVQGHASLLLANRPMASTDREPLQTISAAAERASKLVSQLLTFSRKQFLQIRPMDIRKTVSAVAEMLPQVLGEHITVEVVAASSLPSINADAGMMEQMLMNLALNARDAMTGGGRLIIRAEAVAVSPAAAREDREARPGRFVCLSVSDTGCGIPADILPRIFEPFFTTKPVGKGTGLGLATVYGIAKQHEGWVVVESQPGQGSTFRVFIPVCEQTSQSPPPPLSSQPSTGGDETILVVEDEDRVRNLVAQVLNSHGYHVISAVSGVQALERWSQRTSNIDLLLTDMVMPGGVMGRELARRLLAKDPDLKVIYTSGYSPGMPGQDLPLVEGRNFLAKPYAPARLLQVIRDCLDRQPQVGASSEPVAV